MIYGAAGAWLSSVVPAGAQSEPADLSAQAREAITNFWGAVMSNDENAVAAAIAPEFQIQRANGDRFDAATYPTSQLPIIAEMPVIEDLIVTGDGDVVVTTYKINVNETLDGQVVQAFAPRMTVFRKDGDDWLVVAHSNFAPIR
ncbi:nuclear transport factor 2 family protein [Bauldia sp.]|uniref:nuclear transport factor 2 family protein n=1 Tax=Bauldia sp. TaxID=2575872 RepID=UPI003BADADBB